MTKPPEVEAERKSDIEELRDIAQKQRLDIDNLQGQLRQIRLDINKLFAAVDKP